MGDKNTIDNSTLHHKKVDLWHKKSSFLLSHTVFNWRMKLISSGGDDMLLISRVEVKVEYLRAVTNTKSPECWQPQWENLKCDTAVYFFSILEAVDCIHYVTAIPSLVKSRVTTNCSGRGFTFSRLFGRVRRLRVFTQQLRGGYFVVGTFRGCCEATIAITPTTKRQVACEHWKKGYH